MRDALMVALHREAVDANGQKTKKLYEVAAACVEQAIAGDVSAIREIFDRVDGKSPSGVAGTSEEEPQKVIFQWQSE